MAPIKVTIHSSGEGTCSLTGKECDGITVTFDDGTLSNAFLGWKSFKQLLAMKARQNVPTAKPVTNGAPVAVAK